MEAREIGLKLSEIVGEKYVSFHEADRLSYARDLLPLDTIRMQAGVITGKPDVIVWPRREDELAQVIKFARAHSIPVVPYGAGSGVCGGATPVYGGIVIDLKRMNTIRKIDDLSLLADVEAGMVGEIFERELNRRGYTCGHFPSSMYCSTVGGWLAARGAGQLSSKYGKAEDRVLSLRAVTGEGEIVETPVSPRCAVGPDWNHAIVGSEGTFAVITSVKWRISPYPAHRAFHGFYFPTLADGINAIREIFQSGIKPAVCRLYDPVDTLIAGSGKSKVTEGPRHESLPARIIEDLQRIFPNWQRAVVPRILSKPAPINKLIRKRAHKSKLVLIFEGQKELTEIEHAQAVKICLKNKGEDLGAEPAQRWFSHRYAVSYGLSPIFDLGLFADTMEVATRWSNLEALYNDMMTAIGKHAFVMAHFSHAYPQGCSIYFTFAGGGADLRDRIVKYRAIWDDAMTACLKRGAAVSHHHGGGLLKQNYIISEHGNAFKIVRALKNAFDPDGILNPGKIGL